MPLALPKIRTMDAVTPALPLRARFDAMHRASRIEPEVPLALRLDRLRRLRSLLDEGALSLGRAIEADFGVRSQRVTEVADLFVVRSLIATQRRYLARWMRPRRARTPFYLLPARGYVQPQPLGVVGVISPWNYPVQLALGPAAVALGAGNRVLLKPSELTPRTADWLERSITAAFAPDEFAVVQGGADVAADFAGLPFDHLFFTGSTAVGRKVAQAAACHLTPTTLELGGKSPCIVDASADLDEVAASIAHGKLFNGGQTCIAPDYVLLPAGRELAFAQAYWKAVERLFPSIEGNPDYTSQHDERHAARMHDIAAEAAMGGASVWSRQGPWDPRNPPPPSRQLEPLLVIGAKPGMRLMEEEIFGPILPVLGHGSVDEAIAFINARPRPLALYWFGKDRRVRDRVLARTVSGGVTVNDTLLHIAHENLPFGGVGESGWGAYHGETGFQRFSHVKPVVVQSPWALTHWFHPPYGGRFDRLQAMLRRLV